MTSPLDPGGPSPARMAAVFLAWTMTSFLCHELAKGFLTESLQNWPSIDPFFMAVFLTVAQCCQCLLFTRSFVFNSLEEGSWRLGVVVVISHFLATLATNYSMAYIYASSTFAIKLTEPVVMAVARYLVLSEPVSTHTKLSIPIIVTGALVFSGVSTNSVPGTTGIVLAFASNVALAFRNISMRLAQKESKNSPVICLRGPCALAFSVAIIVLMMCLVVSLEAGHVVAKSSIWLFCLALGSGIFHVTYSYLSTCVVLKVMDVVSHSVCNIFKRLLVVCLLYACGARSASLMNALGLAGAGLGLVIYVRGKFTGLQTGFSFQKFVTIEGVKSAAAIVVSVLIIMAGLRRTQCGKGLGLNLSKRQMVSEAGDSNADTPVLMRKMSGLDDGDQEYESLDFKTEEYKLLDLFEHKTETDFLSRSQPTNQEVVDEAQRVLLNILSHVIGKARHVMLMEIAMYENKGDPAITVGEVMLLRRMNKTVVYYCETHKCDDVNLDYSLEIDKKYAKDDLVILMQGGGNLVGYQTNDWIRKRVLDRYTHRRVVLLSQSIWITQNHHAHLQECIRIYSNRPNLIIFLRDRQSLGLARKHFPGTELVLAPDMAFGIGLVPRQLPPSHDIIWLHRDDHEWSGYEFPTLPSDLIVHVADYRNDWLSNRGSTDMESSFLIANSGLEFLQRGRVVITDRLHGHIMSTLLGIPHVLIDNPPHFKLSSFRKSWTKSLNNTVMVTTGTEALVQARRMLELYKDSLPPVAAFMRAPSVDPASPITLELEYTLIHHYPIILTLLSLILMFTLYRSRPGCECIKRLLR